MQSIPKQILLSEVPKVNWVQEEVLTPLSSIVHMTFVYTLILSFFPSFYVP